MTAISVPRGDDFAIECPILYEDGTAPDLFGATCRWWMANSVGDTEAAAILKKDNISLGGLALTEALDIWTATVSLTHAETSNLSVKSYYHEIYIELAGSHKTVYSGQLKVTPTLIAHQV